MKKVILRILAITVLVLITVSFVNAYTGTAKLSWTPPTTFTDGSVLIPVTDLKGFNIYTGTQPGVYEAPIFVTGGTTTTYTMTIGTGTTYFALSVVGINDLESVKSAEVSKTVIAPSPSRCSLIVQ